MGRSWQVQEAKARFSEFLETSLIEGPQIVTKRDRVLVSIDQWRRLERRTAPDSSCCSPRIAHGDADPATVGRGTDLDFE